MKKHLSIIALFLIITLLSSCNILNTITCDECGAVVSASVKFCSECGSRISQNEQPEESHEGTELQKLSGEELYDTISPSVVTIIAKSSQSTSTGTGFFYTNDIIVTNYHVIEGCTSATITLSDGQSYTASNVMGYNQEKDIALIKVSYSDGKPIPIRNENIKTGEKVYTIGNSLGFLEGSLSEGIVSTANRELDGNVYIQTTASVTHGNSGGPLLDEYGRVIGIVSSGFGDGLDLNLAIPVDEIKTIDTSAPLSFGVFGKTTDPYNVLSNFLKQKGNEKYEGWFLYTFADKNGQTVIDISLIEGFGFISIDCNVDEDFSIDIRIYPNSSMCDVTATLLDRSLATDDLDESLCIAVRGYTLNEVEKTKVLELMPTSPNFKVLYWNEYYKKYYSTWCNYYNNYINDFFIVYDYYITEIAGLSCDSKALGFSFE